MHLVLAHEMSQIDALGLKFDACPTNSALWALSIRHIKILHMYIRLVSFHLQYAVIDLSLFYSPSFKVKLSTVYIVVKNLKH